MKAHSGKLKVYAEKMNAHCRKLKVHGEKWKCMVEN
jgi:hypothetical protein